MDIREVQRQLAVASRVGITMAEAQAAFQRLDVLLNRNAIPVRIDPELTAKMFRVPGLMLAHRAPTRWERVKRFLRSRSSSRYR